MIEPHVRWDDWVSGDRVRKLTDENRELAQNLKKELDATRKPMAPKVVGSKKKHAGSDLSSTRGSEERQSSAPATGRGQKRGRDSEIEKVGSLISPSVASSPLSELSTSDESSFPWDQGHSYGVQTGHDSPPSSKLSGSSRSRELAAMQVTNAARQPLAKRKHKLVSTTTSKSDSEQMESNVDRILSRSPPLEPRFSKVHSNGVSTNYLGMLETRPKKLLKPMINMRRLHPSIKEADLLSCSREAKLQFFMFQNHNLRIMIAGVPMEGSLHPLHIPNPYLTQNTTSSERDGDTNGYHEFDINRSPFQEETFHSRPHIRIPCPDKLKSILVDDWENVTKNLLLVPLPSKTPVNLILDTYFEEEKGKRRLGSAEADLLEEVVAGVKEYFDKCLGRILLYRFEREQFFDVRTLWEGAVGGEWEGKGPGDVYGAEHLARLFGTCK